MLDGQNNADQEWAVIGSSLSVGYKPDRDSDACEFQSVLVSYLAWSFSLYKNQSKEEVLKFIIHMAYAFMIFSILW